MIASTSSLAITFMSSAWSPTSPITNVAAFGTAQSNPVEKSSRTTTRSPASTSACAMWLPMYPAPPVTRMAMVVPLRSPSNSDLSPSRLLLAFAPLLPFGQKMAIERQVLNAGIRHDPNGVLAGRHDRLAVQVERSVENGAATGQALEMADHRMVVGVRRRGDDLWPDRAVLRMRARDDLVERSRADRRRERHERVVDPFRRLEIALRPFRLDARRERHPEVAHFDHLVDLVHTSEIVRGRQNAAIAERARAPFHRAAADRDDLAGRQQVGDLGVHVGRLRNGQLQPRARGLHRRGLGLRVVLTAEIEVLEPARTRVGVAMARVVARQAG